MEVRKRTENKHRYCQGGRKKGVETEEEEECRAREGRERQPGTDVVDVFASVLKWVIERD